MSPEPDYPIPETKVLAVASHVVYGYVGNTMATLVMQSFGCEVAAMNTTQYSNHLGYGQVKGTRTSASELIELWTGLKDSYLDDFDMLLSGYLPDAASINCLGGIAEEIKEKASKNKRSFFWMLDPVMGDNGRLYVSESNVPAYKDLLPHADLILPNQFEAEMLSQVRIINLETIQSAISTLHDKYSIPHILITSIQLNSSNHAYLLVAGSTMTSCRAPRIFIFKVPRIDGYFSGTGDMFAALILIRLREAVYNSPGLTCKPHWCSEDDVQSVDLPLAKATEKVLAGMHEVLTISKISYDKDMEACYNQVDEKKVVETTQQANFELKLAKTKASEVRVVRNISRLKNPSVKFEAMKL